MTQIMLSYPVTLKALKITCYGKHIKCPATPPTSSNTHHSAMHNCYSSPTHHIGTSPYLYCDSNFGESGALSTCHLLPIFLQQLHRPWHTTVTKLSLPQLASQEFCRQHCPVASLCKLHCHFLAVQGTVKSPALPKSSDLQQWHLYPEAEAICRLSPQK